MLQNIDITSRSLKMGENGCKLNISTCCIAAKYEQFEILKWLKDSLAPSEIIVFVMENIINNIVIRYLLFYYSFYY